MNSSPIMASFQGSVPGRAESASQSVSMAVDDKDTPGNESTTIIDASTDLAIASTSMKLNINSLLQLVISYQHRYHVVNWTLEDEVSNEEKGLKA